MRGSSSRRGHHHHLLIPLLRLLSTTTTTSNTPPPSLLKLKNICYRHRSRALKEARSALTEYLHSTRSLPFSFSDHIASNSPYSLSLLLSQIPSLSSSPPSLFPRLLRTYLSYRPVNEFDFLFESIGLSPNPSLGPFLSDHPLLLSSLSDLLRFGFPWTRLGLLYPSLSCLDASTILPKLHSFEALGFDRLSVIALCLCFPSVLIHESNHLLFRDLKAVLVDHGVAKSVSDDVDAHLDICRKIKLFYNLGSEIGTMGEIMGRNKKVFLEVEERLIECKLKYFLKLGMGKTEVGRFLLTNVELLELDLDLPRFTMPEYLLRVGMGDGDAAALVKKCPYAMGRNVLGNLPGTPRAIDVHGWFLERVVGDGGLRFLSAEFVSSSLSSAGDEAEDEYSAGVERLRAVRKQKHHYLDPKLEFLLGIRFGKNKITSRIARLINSTKDQLQERFDCLLEMGIEYPMLYRMINTSPKLLNNCPESLHEKVNYLCNELGYPLEYLNKFPSFLCFDLENRTKPRYRIINWLKENGLLQKPLAPATVLANSEKRFITQLFSVHPAAPKQWLECFSSRYDSNGCQRNLFAHRPFSPSETES